MKILSGKQAENQNEAVSLALQTANVDSMDTYTIDMFETLPDNNKISAEADKVIGSTIRNRYGNKATWRAERWFVPVPKLHYDSKDIPQLIIEIDIYLNRRRCCENTGFSFDYTGRSLWQTRNTHHTNGFPACSPSR